MVDDGPEQVPNDRNTPDKMAREEILKADLEGAWGCKLHHLPQFYHVDFFAERDGVLVAWLEVKHRNCTSTQYPTVFMNRDRKFHHLTAHSYTARSVFVVRWSDGVTRFIDVADVQDDWLGVGGENDRWGVGQHDVEAVYHIPIQEMRAL
jgi:hypothetical protein